MVIQNNAKVLSSLVFDDLRATEALKLLLWVNISLAMSQILMNLVWSD